MGGSSYDRDVYGVDSSSGWGSSGSSGYYGGSSTSSSYARARMSATALDASMLPNDKTLKSKTKSPIILVLDVTGSNINFARIVYDKLPMFYGQIEQQGYLEDFELSICAVGDAYTDDYPMQIGDFAKGIELDAQIEKLVLESGGGGQGMESYELMAYYVFEKTEFEPGAEPIIFFIGDEAPYPRVNKKQARKFGMECDEEMNPFPNLCKKFHDNIFILLNPYGGSYWKDNITNEWINRLPPEHVVKINDEKSIVDLMLGVISMVSKSRTLKNYTVDMLNRGQDALRIAGVTNSLQKLSDSLELVKVNGTITKTDSTKKATQKGKRL